MYRGQGENQFQEKMRIRWTASSGRKKRIIFGGVFSLLLISILILALVFIYNGRRRRYNEGVTALEKKNYREAKDIFTDLGGFDDSADMALIAQMEMDYLSIDRLAAEGKYKKIVTILQTRSDYYEGSDAGEKAAVLADEYELVSEAQLAGKKEDYEEAVKKYEALDELKKEFEEELCLCRVHLEGQRGNWLEVLVNLYGLQSGDYELRFLDTQSSTEDMRAFEAYQNKDYRGLQLLLEKSDGETGQLGENAVKNLQYVEAKFCLDEENYEEAMELFETLGDFLDSEAYYAQAKEEYDKALETLYLEAEEKYSNQEFFKAQKAYIGLGDYKDARKKAQDCVQPLPENGGLKSGNGSSVSLEIEAPGGSESVYLKLYDSENATAGTVFIHPGKSAVIPLRGGSYTIKVAYGSEWYGEKDLFGEGGSYYQLLNETETVFVMESGHSYNLSLSGVTDGNVVSEGLGGAEEM